MNRRILIQAAAPTMVVGLLLSAACLGSAWYINRLQTSMADILAENVTSLRAAQGIEITLRQMRFRCYRYLIAPDSFLLEQIRASEKDFADWLDFARRSVNEEEEWVQIRAIEEGYRRYRADFALASAQARLRGPHRGPRRPIDEDPVQHIVVPCHELYRLNEEMIEKTQRENARLTKRLHLVLLLVGLVGPAGGLILGCGLARGWSRSIHRLSVHVQDMADRLDLNVASVRVVADGDFGNLDKQMQYVVGRVQEVAERLQRQQREMLRAQQMTAVGQLAASVAHEVRNPLTSIKMLVEAALRTDKARPFTRENLQVIHGEVDRLEQTVQGFLSFARPPALKRDTVDLRQVVNQAVDLVRARARQQQVEPVVVMPPEPVLADVDRGQLSTVLVNLFINALDAMPTRGRLEVVVETPPGARARLDVRDTGPGIPAEMAGRLFTPFASTKATGTGLGLSISRRVVEEHGGRIGAVNLPTGGACFTITLPES